MGYVSEAQPLCRLCAKGIKKVTHAHYFGERTAQTFDYSTHHVEQPKSKAEVQRLLNGTVVSIRRDRINPEFVWHASTWDGVSWVDEFFCNADHARQFGYAAARGGQAMAAYHDALAQRRGAL